MSRYLRFAERKRKLNDDHDEQLVCSGCGNSFHTTKSFAGHRKWCSNEKSASNTTFSYTRSSLNKSMCNGSAQGICNNASIGESFKYQLMYQESMASIAHKLKNSARNPLDDIFDEGAESDSDDSAFLTIMIHLTMNYLWTVMRRM